MYDASSTSSIGEVCITLRDDIRFRPQRYGGESCYVIEDPTSSSFFRMGVAEYTLISLFDGEHTIRDAMHNASAVLGKNAFNENQVAAIARWLVDCGLARTNTSSEAQRLHRKSNEARRLERQQWMNPLITRIPVFSPEPLLDRFAPSLMWLASTPMFFAWLMTLLVAIHQLVTYSDRLHFDTANLLAPHNWLWLGLTWLGLKFVHETAHAVVCRKFGGEVREAGIVLIAMAPICYVDVTSSWRFRSKWKRIFVAAAGMYAELFVGAVAALIWIHTDPGPANQMALNVLLLSTVTTLLFNANPLMRFDGYYILSDLLEIPNLATRGQEYVSYLGRRYFYQVDLKCPVGGWNEGWVIRTYGLLAMLWRILITISIGLVAATLFHGLGLALVAMAAVLYVGVPLFQNVKYFLYGRDHEQPQRLRCAALAVTVIAAAMLLGIYSPWPWSVRAPAIVDYQPGGKVRAGVDGFVAELLVEPGQQVRQGQLLAVLENAELASEIKRLSHALAASQTRIRIASRKGDVTAQQFEHENRRDLELQIEERRKQLASLEVRAPMAGQIVSDNLEALAGTFLREGDELLVIGDETMKEFVLSIAQDDADLFDDHAGQPVRVKMRGGDREQLSLDMGVVQPGAATGIEHFAITAAGGGCVPVRPGVADSDEQWEFIEPRLSSSIALPTEVSSQFRAGQLAMVRLPIARSTLGEGLYRSAEKWFRVKWRQMRGISG